MKKKVADSISPEKGRYRVTINPNLKPLNEHDSPFLQRKMAEARAFLTKHPLPDGWRDTHKKTDTE